MNQEETPNQNASVFETYIIPEDESDKGQNDDDNELSFQPPDPIQAINNSETAFRTDHPNETTTEDIQQTHNDSTSAGEFSLELLHTIPDDREPTIIGAQDKLMRWHYRLNHLSFKHLFQLAKQGLLPKKILKANVPICPACQYSKMHHRPWRTKGIQPKASRAVTKPG